MGEEIDIKGIEKAELLAALYNRAKVQGLGFLQAKNGDMTIDEAQKIVEQGYLYFDYLKGRVMKVNLEGDTLNPSGFDRDNGQGAVKSVVDALRSKQQAPKVDQNLADGLESAIEQGYGGFELRAALEERRGDFGLGKDIKPASPEVPKEKERVTLNMSMLDVFESLSEGNVRAIQVLDGIAKATAEIDPYGMAMDGRDFMVMLNVDSLRLYGAKLVALNKICGDNYEYTAAVIRGWQLGFVSTEAIHKDTAAVLNGDKSTLDVDDIILKVQKRISGYKALVREVAGTKNTTSEQPSPKMK